MCELYWLNDVMKQKDVLEFFIKFSRFEYALKCNNYYKVKKDQSIETDFDKFSKEYEDKKLNQTLQDFLKYLDNDPVGKLTEGQKYIKNKIISNNNIFKLLGYLRRIRNNLFHGVKYPNLTNYDNFERGKKLIDEGIHAIDFLASLNENVFSTYKG